jgi:hypothetical protein
VSNQNKQAIAALRAREKQVTVAANRSRLDYEAQLKAIAKRIEQIEEVETGNRPDAEQERRIATQRFSFEVHFERRKALKKGRSPGEIGVSQRRFSSPKEANQHGTRFTKIQKHKGFYVVQVQKRANAWINWATGKTNPVIG